MQHGMAFKTDTLVLQIQIVERAIPPLRRNISSSPSSPFVPTDSPLPVTPLKASTYTAGKSQTHSY